jgi:hypothetical protein
MQSIAWYDHSMLTRESWIVSHVHLHLTNIAELFNTYNHCYCCITTITFSIKWNEAPESIDLSSVSMPCTNNVLNPYIEEEQITQWPKEKVQKDKQRSTKHTYKTNDRVTRTQLKTGVELILFYTFNYNCWQVPAVKLMTLLVICIYCIGSESKTSKKNKSVRPNN